MATKKPTLKEQNAALLAELTALKVSNLGRCMQRLSEMTDIAARYETKCDQQIERIAELEVALEKVQAGNWDEVLKARKEAAELLDCEPDEIVKHLKRLRDDLGCEESDTLLDRADTLTAEAAAYADANDAADDFRTQNDLLSEALAAAIADRKALLERLGLTDYAWSAQGGACWADVEV